MKMGTHPIFATGPSVAQVPTSNLWYQVIGMLGQRHTWERRDMKKWDVSLFYNWINCQ